MKLKKILSLAAAGVMAVSMLTACGEGANEIIDPAPNPTPSASTVVSTFEDAIKAHSKATVNVVESEKLNARIDAINDKLTYAEMMPGGKVSNNFVDAIESAFGVDEMTNLMESDKPAALECGTHWYYAVVDAGAVSGTTALNWAANEIADRMSALEDEYIRDELMAGVGVGVVGGDRRYNGKPDRPDHGKPDRPGTVVGGVVFEQNVAHTADYTMFVKQVNMTATGDTEVPITIAVLKVNVAEKV